MSKVIRLSDELQLPIDIVTMRVAIFGTSDAGKTTFARLVAERVHGAGQRFCAIDLKNDWWGLKSSADGSAPGIPIVIFGGPKRDIQIFEDAGAATADTIASIEQSCVIDLDDFHKRKQLVFLTAFLNRLYDINRKPLFLLADEADRYAPQQPGMDVAYESLGASEDICRRGRKRGIGSMWITQRNAVLNKSVSNMCDLTVVFRTPGSRDLKELKDSVGRIANEEQLQAVMKAAPGLDNGQVILLSAHPKLRKFMPPGATPLQMPMPATFDSSATPRVGQRKREPKVLAKTDLAQIEERMAKQVERAKAEDPKELRTQLVRLQRDLASKAAECSRQFTEIERLKQSPGKPDPKQTIRATEVVKAQRALEEAMKFIVEISTKNFDGSVPEAELRTAVDGAVKQALKKIEAIFANRDGELTDLKKRAMKLIDRMKAIIESDVSVKMEVRHNQPFTVAPTPTPRASLAQPREAIVVDENFRITPKQQEILNAIAWFESIGNPNPSGLQVGAVALIDSSGGHFSNVVGPLTSNGLVVRGGGALALTDRGREFAQVPERVGTLDDYHEVLRRRVRKAKSAGGKTVEMLNAIIDKGGAELTAEAIGLAVGIDHTGGHFSNMIGPLSTLGLIKRAHGVIRPTEIIFPPGLR